MCAFIKSSEEKITCVIFFYNWLLSSYNIIQSAIPSGLYNSPASATSSWWALVRRGSGKKNMLCYISQIMRRMCFLLLLDWNSGTKRGWSWRFIIFIFIFNFYYFLKVPKTRKCIFFEQICTQKSSLLNCTLNQIFGWQCEFHEQSATLTKIYMSVVSPFFENNLY